MPVPDHTLAQMDAPGSSIQFGSVELFYPESSHVPDNLFVWVPSEGVLFGGCAVRAAASNSLGGVADTNIAEWPDVIRRDRARYVQAKVVVPGHGAVGDFSLLNHTLELLNDLTGKARIDVQSHAE